MDVQSIFVRSEAILLTAILSVALYTAKTTNALNNMTSAGIALVL
jgi:hypothetical protein